MWQGLIAIIAMGLINLIAIVSEPEVPEIFVIPPMPQYSADELFEECICDDCCYELAVKEYADEFTALFNSYETKRAKNGALMIRKGNSGSYRFAKKG